MAQIRFPKRTRATGIIRANGAPSITAKLVELNERGVTGVKPLLCAAMGINFSERERMMSLFIHSYGASRLAEMYAEINPITGDKVAEEDERAITIVGELTAIHAYDGMSCSRAQIEDARRQLLSFLQSHPIPVNEVKKFVIQLLKACKNFGSATRPRDKAEEMIGELLGYPENLNAAKVKYYECRGNMFKAEMFSAATWTELLPLHEKLKTINIYEMMNLIIPATIEMCADWPTVWTGLTDEERLALVEGVAINNSEYHSCAILLATAGCIANLTKQGNASPSWCSNLTKRLAKKMPAVNNHDAIKLTTDFFRDFHTSYPVPVMDNQTIFSLIQALYTLMTDAGIEVLTWILEQSAMHNITLAVEFCRVMNRHPNANIPYFLNRFMTQVAALAKLTGNMAYNRFSSVVIPPVTMAEYPDLAYMAKYVGLQNRNPDKKIAYQGNPMAFATRTEEQLIALADQIIKEEIAIQSDQMALESRVGELRHKIASMPADQRANLNLPVDIQGKDIIAIGNEIYVVSPEDIEAHVQTLEPDDRLAYRQQYARAKQNLWDRKAQILPPSAKKVSLDELSSMENRVDSGKVNAFKLMCTTMESLSKQAVIEVIVDSRNTGSTPYKPIEEELFAALNLLGANLDPAMTRQVHPHNDINVRKLDEIDVLRRGTIPPPDPATQTGGNPPGPRQPPPRPLAPPQAQPAGPSPSSGGNQLPDPQQPSLNTGITPQMGNSSPSDQSFATVNQDPFRNVSIVLDYCKKHQSRLQFDATVVMASFDEYTTWLNNATTTEEERYAVILHDINDPQRFIYWNFIADKFVIESHPVSSAIFAVWSTSFRGEIQSNATRITDSYDCVIIDQSLFAIPQSSVDEYFKLNSTQLDESQDPSEDVSAVFATQPDYNTYGADQQVQISNLIINLLRHFSLRQIAVVKDLTEWMRAYVRMQASLLHIFPQRDNVDQFEIDIGALAGVVRNTLDQIVTTRIYT